MYFVAYHTWNGTLCSTLVLDSVMKVGCRAVLRVEGISALIVLCNNVMNTCLTFIGGFPNGHPTQPQQVLQTSTFLYGTLCRSLIYVYILHCRKNSGILDSMSVPFQICLHFTCVCVCICALAVSLPCVCVSGLSLLRYCELRLLLRLNIKTLY